VPTKQSWPLAAGVIAIAYICSGWLGVALAVQPTNVTAIFPPAGIVLAALLVLGVRYWTAVWLGAFLLNASVPYFFSGAITLDDIALAIVIALGATAQAVLGARLIKRYVPSYLLLDEASDILRFLVLGGPVACIIPSLAGVAALRGFGIIATETMLTYTWTWWVGNVMGVIMLAPMTLAILLLKTPLWRERINRVGLPSFGALIVVVSIFLNVNKRDIDHAKDNFLQLSAPITQRLQADLFSYISATNELRLVMQIAPALDRESFDRVAAEIIANRPAIQALEWVPRVTKATRASHEAMLENYGVGISRILERTEAGSLAPAATRDEYFPVYYLYPLSGNEGALGFDLASDPTRRAYMDLARDSGKPVATSRIDLIQVRDSGPRAGILVFEPVFNIAMPMQTVEQRQSALTGFVVGVLRIDGVIANALPSDKASDIVVEVVDTTQELPGTLLYGEDRRRSSVEGNGTFVDRRPIDMAGRHWIITIRASEAYVNGQRSLQTWIIFAAGLMFSGLLQALLLAMTGQASNIKREVEEKTAALAKSEAHLREIIDSSPVPCAINDGQGNVTFLNRSFVQTFGYTREDIPTLEQWWQKACPDSTYQKSVSEEWSGRLETARKSGKPFEPIDLDIRTKTGTILHVIGSAAPLRHGSNSESLVTLQDVTERRRALDALNEAKQAADSANAAKSQFLAMMSHELRTPMTGVLGMADLLLSGDLGEEQCAHVRTLRRSALSLLELLNDILDFAKIESGKIDLEVTDFSLLRLVDEIRAIISPLASERGNSVAIDADAAMLPAYRGDASRIRQVLMNLVSNANKFTSEGTIEIRLRQQIRCDGQYYVSISVVDSGIGIPQETLARLFQPFVQADASTSRKFGGSGLGLAISRRLAELMGGGVTVDSQPGRGSTFTFTVALAAGDASVIERRHEPRGKVSKSQLPEPARPLRVLVAEDNETNRALLISILTRMGHAVTAVENGALAVAAAIAAPPEIILMDMQMPVMDGETAMQQLKALNSSVAKVPIIALTADTLRENHERYLASGALAVVTKPVNWHALSRQMDGATGRKEEDAPMPSISFVSSSLLSPLLELDMMETIAGLVELEKLHELLGSFRKNVELYAASLPELAAAGDAVEVRKTAHALKGLASQFGALRLSELALALESAAFKGQILRDRVGEISEVVTQTLTVIDDWLRAYPGRAAAKQ